MESFCSDQIRELAQALIKVQERLQPATKDANNLFTKSKYATLNSVMDSCRDALLSTASGFVSIRFLPNRGILGWSQSSPTWSQDNGSRAFGHAWHRNGGRYEWRVCFRQVQPSSETEKSRKRPTERQNDSG